MEKNYKTMVKKTLVHIRGGGGSGELDLINQNVFFKFPYAIILFIYKL